MANPYRIYIDGMLLPVTPEKIMTEIKNQNKTINLIDSREYNMLKTPGLTGIVMTVLLPAQDAHYVQNYQPQQVYLDKFEELKTDKEKKVFEFMIIRSDTNPALSDTYFEMASMEEYNISETSEYAKGDLIVDLYIKRFEDIATKEVEVKARPGATATGESGGLIVKEKPKKAASKTIPKTHKVVKGDTLWHLAERYLGDGMKYKDLHKLNPEITNPNLIYPGQIVKLKG